MFIQQAFIRRNTPELRKKLEELGIKEQFKSASDTYILAVHWYNGYYIDTYEDTQAYREYVQNFIDCGTNESLFLAIAALRDDSDYMQWFIIDEFIRIGIGGNIVGLEPRRKVGEKWIFHTGNDLRVTNSIKEDIIYSYYGKSDMRKATVEELINHFKDKQKNESI